MVKGRKKAPPAGYRPMTADEYRAAVDRIAASSPEAGALLGIAAVSSRRYATDAQKVPPTLAILVRLIEAQRLTAEQIRAWLEPFEVA